MCQLYKRFSETNMLKLFRFYNIVSRKSKNFFQSSVIIFTLVNRCVGRRSSNQWSSSAACLMYSDQSPRLGIVLSPCHVIYAYRKTGSSALASVFFTMHTKMLRILLPAPMNIINLFHPKSCYGILHSWYTKQNWSSNLEIQIWKLYT